MLLMGAAFYLGRLSGTRVGVDAAMKAHKEVMDVVAAELCESCLKRSGNSVRGAASRL
jgi:hypothetical protein